MNCTAVPPTNRSSRTAPSGAPASSRASASRRERDPGNRNAAGTAMMDPAAERRPRSGARGLRSLGDVQGPIPSLSRPVSGQQRPSTEAVFSRIGPKPDLRPRGGFIPAWIRWTTKGERAGEARRRELSGGCSPPPRCGVGPVWETRRAMSRLNSPETRNPASGEGGVSVSLRSWSCKVDGNGNDSAECKRNLLDHPDVAQR